MEVFREGGSDFPRCSSCIEADAASDAIGGVIEGSESHRSTQWHGNDTTDTLGDVRAARCFKFQYLGRLRSGKMVDGYGRFHLGAAGPEAHGASEKSAALIHPSKMTLEQPVITTGKLGVRR